MKTLLISLFVVSVLIAWLAVSVADAVTKVEAMAAQRDAADSVTAEKRSQLRRGELRIFGGGTTVVAKTRRAAP